MNERLYHNLELKIKVFVFYWLISSSAKKHLGLKKTEFCVHLLGFTTISANSYFYSPFAKEETSLGRFIPFLNVPPEGLEPGWSAEPGARDLKVGVWTPFPRVANLSVPSLWVLPPCFSVSWSPSKISNITLSLEELVFWPPVRLLFLSWLKLNVFIRKVRNKFWAHCRVRH